MSCGDRTLDPAAATSAAQAAAGSSAPATAAPPIGSECVQGAVIWYGVFDFAPVLARGGAGDNAFLGCAGACAPDKVQRASPVHYIGAGDPPFLLIHGEGDRVVDVSQSRQGEAALRAAGVSVQSIYIPFVDHSFIGRTPQETRAATLAATNATFDFLHQLFGKVKP